MTSIIEVTMDFPTLFNSLYNTKAEPFNIPVLFIIVKNYMKRIRYKFNEFVKFLI